MKNNLEIYGSCRHKTTFRRFCLNFFPMLNVQFRNYYVPSCVCVRGPPFNHLDSTYSYRLSLTSSLTISVSHFSRAGQQNKGKVAQIPWARSTTQPSHPRDITHHPISHLSTSKVISTPRCAIPRHRAPLEEFFLAFRKIFSLFTHRVLTLLLMRLLLVVPPPRGGDYKIDNLED